MNYIKLIRISLVLLSQCFVVNAHAEIIDRIIAVVNEKPISLSELRERETYLSKSVPESLKGEERVKWLEDIRKRVFESLIEDLLLEQEVERSGMTVTDTEIDEAIEDVKKQNNLNDVTLAAALEREGLTIKVYRLQMKRQIEKSRLIGRQVRSKVTITEKDMRDYYDNNTRLFLKADEVTVSQILFSVPDKAGDAEIEQARGKATRVLEMAKEGREFSQLAREFSDDPSGKNGGAMGTFKKGQLLPELERAAFSMEKGDISDPVRTRLGFHILRLDTIKEGVPEDFEKVREKIRSTLNSEMMEQRYKEWMEELKKSASIERRL